MRRLRVGLVGFGWFGRIHAQAWARVPSVELVAICDRDAAALENGGGALPQDAFHRDAGHAVADGPRASRYQSLEAMLAAERLDLVDVVAPEAEHVALARSALAAGVDVIVEKPFASVAAEARALVAEARALGRRLYAGHILRFDRRHRALKEDLDSRGAALRHLSLQRHFQSSALAVYGRSHPFLAALVHDIDIALWLTGRRVARVQATTHGWRSPATVDVAVGQLRWDDGLVATLQNSWHLAAGCPYGFEFDTRVFADGATYTLRNEPVLQVWDGAGAAAPELFFWPLVGGQRDGALVDELTHFAGCAAAGIESSRVPLDDVVHGLEVAEALVRASHSQQWEPVT
ncbi:MAG TPA: Gfo/Idh/MocA family oxidoreductase [Polyangia bacterium]|jgi:predicted dehydrogenase